MSVPRVALGIVTAALLVGATLAVAQSSGAKKPLGKLTCEDFLGIEDSIKPQMVRSILGFRALAQVLVYAHRVLAHTRPCLQA